MQIRNSKQWMQSGYVLMITLIFVLFLSLLIVSQTDMIVISLKSEATTKQYQALFYRAESGVIQTEKHLLGKDILLPPSSIIVNTHLENVNIDSCGNKTLDIVSVAAWHLKRFVLRSREIFARVPIAKSCKKNPPIQRLWWKENESQ